MYKDWKQWVRLVYSVVVLLIGLRSIVTDIMDDWIRWGRAAGILQLSLLVLSAGLLIPKAERFSYELTSDTKQFIAGVVINLLGWLMIFL